jgi:hypothetical protein
MNMELCTREIPPAPTSAMSDQTQNPDTLELGAWVARTQVFAAVAGQCSFAQAECLRKIKESDAHKALGLTWEEFCPRYLGLRRSRVDAIIQNVEEFGKPYFRLAELVPISPETYRAIAPHVADGETIDLGKGQVLELVPENAAAIRAAIAKLRAAKPERPPDSAFAAEFKSLRRRMRSLFGAYAALTPQISYRDDFEELRRIFHEFQTRFDTLENDLRKRGYVA